MRTPTTDTIKAREKNYYLVRKASYNGRTTERVEWQVWERKDDQWRLEREYNTKRDAIHWLYVCAKV